MTTSRHPSLMARSPFAGLSPSRTPRALVGLRDRGCLDIATMTARRNAKAALETRVRERFGLPLPDGPQRIAAERLALLGIGPTSWLAIAEPASHRLASSLAQAAGDAACVCDQSGAFGVLRVSGARVRDTLCKLVALDLHPQVFTTSRVARTSAAHVDITVWRLEDQPDGSAAFDIAVPRSLARSFWEALCESGAEFGLQSTE